MSDNIDISVPILIARYNDKLVVIDGFHRLKKAIKLGKKELPAKYINDRLLSYFEIR
jgi:ParB-like chromosome segregation protein Spo0J